MKDRYTVFVSGSGLSSKKWIRMSLTFSIHSYVCKKGKSQLFLTISCGGERNRRFLPIKVSPQHWDKEKGRAKRSCPDFEMINLMLDKIESDFTQIRQRYFLNQKPLTLEKLLEEYDHKESFDDFIAFWELELSRQVVKQGSYKKEVSRINKLKRFRAKIPFYELSVEFFDTYIHYMSSECKNNANTIASNIGTIKKYLNLAKKRGYILDFDPSDIKTKSSKSNRKNLTMPEIRRLISYYNSEYIKERHRLPLGYFLFCCFTGIRLNEVKKLTRDTIGKTITFTSDKTGKLQTLPVNQTARQIVDSYDKLFEKWISDQKMNDYIREACVFVGIKKHVSFHVSRHSFATNFLRCGGKVEDLQNLLSHSSISTTMEYVHAISCEQIDTSVLDI